MSSATIFVTGLTASNWNGAEGMIEGRAGYRFCSLLESGGMAQYVLCSLKLCLKRRLLYPMVSSNMAGWKITDLNGGV